MPAFEFTHEERGLTVSVRVAISAQDYIHLFGESAICHAAVDADGLPEALATALLPALLSARQVVEGSLHREWHRQLEKSGLMGPVQRS